jgi:hypothetical protein
MIGMQVISAESVLDPMGIALIVGGAPLSWLV